MVRCASLCLLLAVTSLCQGAPAPQQAPSTLRTDVQLVTIDVVVTDKKGKPVHGLPQSSFTLQENKAPLLLKGFEEHSTAARSAAAITKLPTGTFANTPATRVGSVDVLLIDALNTPSAAQTYLRDQLVHFLASQQTGRQSAIFVLNTRLAMLQDFTIDPAILKKAVQLQGVKFSPLNRELIDPAIQQQSETLSDMAAANPSTASLLLDIQTTLLDMNARQQSQQTQVRARTTMDALEQLARYLAGVPGRKNLLWFSGAFPTFIQRDIQTTGNAFAGNADLSSEFAHTVNVLAQNQIAVYPIDARGIDIPPSQTPTTDDFNTGLGKTRQVYGTNSATPRDDAFWTDQANEHATMASLADGTGGRAFYNTNALTAATEQATDDGESYYTLLYTPPPGSRPGQFRNVSVQVNQPGFKLAYRKGYYAATPASATPQALTTALSHAMGPDAADSSEIALQVTPATSTETADPSNIIGFKAAGPQPATYALNLSVAMQGLNFVQGPDGKMHGALLFATVLYTKNGTVIDSRQDRANLALDVSRYQSMLTGGIRYHALIALPANAEGSVRIAVQDQQTGRIGSMHLRNTQLQKQGAQATR